MIQHDLPLEILKKTASSIRGLAADAVEASTTGHPGMALGMADFGAVFYGELLTHYNRRPDWINRDRFVLSAGHGAMLLYSLLHLSGYDLPKDELKRFRRAGSLTPGHPEHDLVPGIETTTGPLGAGFATAVGMALAEKVLADRFNREGYPVIDHHTFNLSGDGCMMEGVTAEAASIAGHLKLGKLIVFYDSNDISIEGPTSITFSEDTSARFRAYGWQTLSGSAHDFAEIAALTEEAKRETERPTLIVLKSIIGKGAPNMQGKHKVHGAPIGAEEIQAMKTALGMPPEEDFYVFPEVYEYFKEKEKEWESAFQSWQSLYEEWSGRYPELAEEFECWMRKDCPRIGDVDFPRYEPGIKKSSRDAGGEILQALADGIPNLLGGSADLGPTNRTEIKGYGDLAPEHLQGRTIRFGVREHSMASIVNGMTLHGGFHMYCATLFVFIDYMRPALRLASLMKLPVVYILTHDSIFLGADGPTHQPIEHITSLRIIPDFRLLRPADAEETVEAWKMALERTDGPTAIALSRQPLTVFKKTDPEWQKNIRRGAYIAQDCEGEAEATILATGSEVNMAMDAAALLPDKQFRIISVLSREMLDEQDEAFTSSLIPPDKPVYAVEAGVRTGWEAYTGSRSRVFSIDRFGLSGRPEEIAEELGFTVTTLADLLRKADGS
jgi:transketolase